MAFIKVSGYNYELESKTILESVMIIRFLIKTTIVLVLILIGYYLIYLKPKYDIPILLLDTEKEIQTQHFKLIENRASYTELVRLNPLDTNFDNKRAEVFSTLVKSNTEGLDSAKEIKSPKNINGAPNKTLNFINSELPETLSSLKHKNIQIYERQADIIESLKKYNQIVKNIYSYNPQKDLSSLDPNKDKDQLSERLANAKNGLGKIKTQIADEYKDSEKAGLLINQLDVCINLLSEIEVVLNNKNSVNIANQLTAFENQFDEVKKGAYNFELSITNSSESVKLLADQTNLMFDYERLLTKIKDY